MLLSTYNHHHNETHLYLVHLCSRLDLDLFMSYLIDLFFIFSLIFIIINYIISLTQAYLFFAQCFTYLQLFLDDNVDEES